MRRRGLLVCSAAVIAAEHNRKRSLTAQQLEKIRDTIIRYSDLAAKRRAENT